MFFTFFKGEKTAYQVYDMIIPCIKVYFDEKNDRFLEATDPLATPDKKIIRI
jgi:hypothetical protein